MHKFVIAIILFETNCCSGFNFTIPNLFENMCEHYDFVMHNNRNNNMTFKIKKFCSDYFFGIEVDDPILVLCISELKEKGCSVKRFDNMCEQYNFVIHDDQNNNMTYKIKKFCSDYYFGIEADNTILGLCVTELKEKRCSLKEVCLSEILNNKRTFKMFLCIEHSFNNCLENLEIKFNIKLDKSIHKVKGSEKLVENIIDLCASLSSSSIFRGFSYLPFCSQLNITVHRNFYGKIDLSVWKSASTKLVCKLIKIKYKN